MILILTNFMATERWFYIQHHLSPSELESNIKSAKVEHNNSWEGQEQICGFLCKKGWLMTSQPVLNRTTTSADSHWMQTQTQGKTLCVCVWMWAGALRRERSNVWQRLWLNIPWCRILCIFRKVVLCKEAEAFGTELRCNLNWCFLFTDNTTNTHSLCKVQRGF